MRVLAIVNQRDAGPGVFAEAIRERGVELGRELCGRWLDSAHC